MGGSSSSCAYSYTLRASCFLSHLPSFPKTQKLSKAGHQHSYQYILCKLWRAIKTSGGNFWASTSHLTDLHNSVPFPKPSLFPNSNPGANLLHLKPDFHHRLLTIAITRRVRFQHSQFSWLPGRVKFQHNWLSWLPEKAKPPSLFFLIIFFLFSLWCIWEYHKRGIDSLHSHWEDIPL